MNLTGAGVLVVTHFNGVPSVLLVYSNKNQAWEEPGGGIHHTNVRQMTHEKTTTNNCIEAKQTASKELQEETANLIKMSCETMCNAFDTRVKKRQPQKCYYRSYVVHAELPSVDTIRYAFFQNLAQLQRIRVRGIRAFLESSDITLVPLALLTDFQKSGNRKVYHIHVHGVNVPVTKRLKQVITNAKTIERITAAFAQPSLQMFETENKTPLVTYEFA